MMASTPRPRPVILLTSALLLAGLPLGCGKAPAPEEKPPPAPVKWTDAGEKKVKEWTEILGTTQPLPDRAARITAPVEGHVVSVLQGAKGQTVVEGQRVKKGDVIVQLDARVVKANRDKLKATLKKLDDQEEQARIAVDLAQVEVTKLKKLKSQGVTVAEPDIRKAELLLEEAQSKQKSVKTDREAGQAELAALEVQLGLYTLTAPIDGVLGRLLVVSGQTLTPGTLVADVVNLDDKIDVLCFVPPNTARRLQKGQEAAVGSVGEQQPATTASPEGTVEFIADQAEVDTGNFAVKIRFPNNELKLRVHTTLRVRVLTTPGKVCLTLPESALLDDKDPPEVVVVEEYEKKKIKVKEQGQEKEKEIEIGKARRLKAKVGIRDRVLRLVEIISLDDPEKKWKGTLETAKFVYEKGQGLRTGDAIKLEEEEEEGE
jgi:RND family efflux transporter MFP subunit